jgi:hypothetical protein
VGRSSVRLAEHHEPKLHAVGTNERPLSHHVARRASDGCRLAGSQAVTLLVKLVCGKPMKRVRFAVGFPPCNHGQHPVLVEPLPREDHVHNHGSAPGLHKSRHKPQPWRELRRRSWI